MFILEIDTTEGTVRKAAAMDLLTAEVTALAMLENPDVRAVRIRAGEGGKMVWDKSNAIDKALGDAPISRYVRALPDPEPGTVVICIVADLNSADDGIEGTAPDRFDVAARILGGEGVGKDVTDAVARAAIEATHERLAEVPALIPQEGGLSGGAVGEA